MIDRASFQIVNDVSLPYRMSRIAALLTCAVMVACGVDQAEEPFGTGAYEASVMAQLDASMQTLAAKGVQLQLVNFTPADALDSDAAVVATKSHILDTTAMVPQFNGV